MEGTGCLADVSMCSPCTWARAGSASPIAKPVAASAQPFENARLETFISSSPRLQSGLGPVLNLAAAIGCRQAVKDDLAAELHLSRVIAGSTHRAKAGAEPVAVGYPKD